MDTIEIEVLEDGVISVTTDGISGANHMSADELLAEIEELAGGTRTTTKRERPKNKKRLGKVKSVSARG